MTNEANPYTLEELKHASGTEDLSRLSLEDLESERLDLIEDMNGIRNQLATRKAAIDAAMAVSSARNSYGSPRINPVEYAEYAKWRASATSALRYKEVKLGDVKRALRDRRQEADQYPKQKLADAEVERLRLVALLNETREALRDLVNVTGVQSHNQAALNRARAVLARGAL